MFHSLSRMSSLFEDVKKSACTMNYLAIRLNESWKFRINVTYREPVLSEWQKRMDGLALDAGSPLIIQRECQDHLTLLYSLSLFLARIGLRLIFHHEILLRG